VLAAAYFIILVVAVAGESAASLGWRPPPVPLWDGRAHLYFLFTCFALALISSLGLAALTPTKRWPKLLRATPAMMAVCVVGFGFEGLSDLNSNATAVENLTALSRTLAIAVGT